MFVIVWERFPIPTIKAPMVTLTSSVFALMAATLTTCSSLVVRSSPSLSHTRRFLAPRCAVVACDGAACEEEDSADDDNMECTTRIVTELRESNNSTLPDRFLMAMRAIRGEFSPAEGSEDNEYVEDALTAALLKFPAKVSVRVISYKIETDDEAACLAEEIGALVSEVHTSIDGSAPAIGVATRGERRSYDLALTVPSADSLAALRGALKEDVRVQMVF